MQKNFKLFIVLMAQSILFSIIKPMISKYNLTYGLDYIITVLISFLPAIFLMRNYFDFSCKSSLSIKKFFVIFSILFTLNFFVSIGTVIFDKFLVSSFHITGRSADTQTKTTILFFIYSAILGPIVEELLYRSLLLNYLRKFGDIFAIVLSAIFFCFIHHDLYQGIAAFFTGIILGYVFVKYSLKYSIILHILNNSLVDIFDLLKKLPSVGNILVTIITICLFIIGIISLIKFIIKRKYYLKDFTKKKDGFDILVLVALLYEMVLTFKASFNVIK